MTTTLDAEVKVEGNIIEAISGNCEIVIINKSDMDINVHS